MHPIFFTLVLFLPSTLATVNCRSACLSCHAKDHPKDMVEIYCAMCHECKERRKKRILAMLQQAQPSSEKTSTRTNGQLQLANKIYARQMSDSTDEPDITNKNIVQDVIPPGCPTAPPCSDDEDPPPTTTTTTAATTTTTTAATTTSTTTTSTTTTTTTPKPICPPIKPCKKKKKTQPELLTLPVPCMQPCMPCAMPCFPYPPAYPYPYPPPPNSSYPYFPPGYPPPLGYPSPPSYPPPPADSSASPAPTPLLTPKPSPAKLKPVQLVSRLSEASSPAVSRSKSEADYIYLYVGVPKNLLRKKLSISSNVTVHNV